MNPPELNGSSLFLEFGGLKAALPTIVPDKTRGDGSCGPEPERAG